MVQDPGDDEVDQVRDPFRSPVEARRGGKDDDPETGQAQLILECDGARRRLSGYEDEGTALFECHGRSPRNEVVRDPARDLRQVRPAASDEYHGSNEMRSYCARRGAVHYSSG